MKNIFNKIIAVILGAMMLTGVGVSFAVSPKASQVKASELTTGYTKITSVDSLSTDDLVVIYNDSLSSGVSGMNSNNKDALISATEADWVQYTVTKSSSTFTLHTGTSYINIVNKSIKYGTATNLSVTSEGALCDTASTPNILQANSTYYRPYANNTKYSKFFVYKVDSEPTPTQKYSVIFNANGEGVTNMPSNLTNQSGIVSLSSVSSPSRSGYEFLGWSLTSSGEVVSSVTVSNADVNVYAIWQLEPAPASGSYKFIKLTSVDEITEGDYVIACHTGSGYMAMSNTFASNISGSSISVTDDMITDDMSDYVVTIEIVNNNIAITNGTKYLGYGTSGTSFTYSATTSSDSKQQWSVTNSSYGTFKISNASTTTRGIVYRTSTYNRFAAYSTSNINGSEYYGVELFRAFKATDFAEHILTKITCNASGSSAPTYIDDYSWSVLSSEFTDKLSSDEQTLLVEAEANELGNTIEQAVAKYDLIVSKYGYSNFMSRTVASYRITTTLIIPDTDSITVVVISTILSITTISIFVILKKKKYNN